MIAPPASLRARMTRLFTVGFGAFVLVSGAAIWLWSWQSALRFDDTLSRDAVSLMQREWQDSPQTVPKNRARIVVEELNEDPRFLPVTAFILDDTGRVLASSHAPSHVSPDTIKSGDWKTIRQTSQKQDAVFIASVNAYPAEHAARQQAGLLGILALLAVGAASRAAWILVGRTLQPIDLLSRQAALISQTASDALSAQMTAPSNDAEVRHLVQTLNALLARVHDTATRRQQWYAAASHELRTPLAVLSGTAEVALSRSRTAAEYEETLQGLQTQTRRLIALSEGVLLLSRLESGTTGDTEPSAPVCLGETCRLVLDALAPLIEARNLGLHFDAGDLPTLVCAPPSHLAMLARNLIENAVKYAAGGGQVRITVSSLPTGPKLSVFNTHDTAAHPIDFARIWEPFYRENYVRSAGSGLGLAICARLAEVNRWQLEMANAPGGVCVFAHFAPAPGIRLL